MVETETKFNKVVEFLLGAVRKRGEKPTPEQVSAVMNRIYSERTPAVHPTHSRTGRIIENAKKIFTEAKSNGQHVTTGLGEWIKSNKFPVLNQDTAKALAIAKRDLDITIKASKLGEDSWIVREATKVQCAEAAQALSVIALAPKELREDPHFLFQTAAQLAGTNSNPEAQPTIKAFIIEMNSWKGKDGFDIENNELRQLLTEAGMGAMPTPPPPDNFQGVDFSSLPANTRNLFRALNGELSRAVTDPQKYEVLTAFSMQIADVDSSTFTQSQHEVFSNILKEKARLESKMAPSRGIDRKWFEDKFEITPSGEGDFHARGLTIEQVKIICDPPDDDGDAGIDKYIHSMMRRIFSGSREPRSPDLQEQSEYWEIEQLWRYLFGEDRAQAKLAELRSFWESEYRRNAINWHLIRGGSSAKDLITKYSEGIPPDTLQHEKSIFWAPEAITAYEQTEFEIAAEQRFVFDQGQRWFEQPSASVVGLSRLEAYAKGGLTGAESDEAKEWAKKIGYGSMTLDKDAQFNEPVFNNLTNLHGRIEREYQKAKVVNPHLTEQDFYDAYTTRPRTRGVQDSLDELHKAWAEFTLFENPEDFIGDRLWNTDVLNKWQGFSPLQIRAMIKLEAMLKDKGIKDLDTKTWKLARAISAASRYQVGSLRTVTLTHQLANMPGLVVEPAGSDVMIAGWQEQLGRVQNSELFIRRFSMGGENQGLPIWSNLIVGRLEGIGVKLQAGDRMQPAQTEEEDFFMRKARTMLLKSRKHYGIGFTEVPRPPLLGDLSAFDDTTWRNDRAVWQELQSKYGEHAKNVAHGIQLQLNSGLKKEPERQRIWGGKAMRNPSKLVQLMATKGTDDALIVAGMTPGNKEWQQFMKVLLVVEHRINTDEVHIRNDAINLGRWTQFNQFFTENTFKACGVTDRVEQERLKHQYFRVITKFQRTFLHGKPPGESLTYREIWAKNDMAITVSMVDFDVGLAAWDKLPADQQLRRVVSDAAPHLMAMESLISFHTKPELCLQPNSKKVIEELTMMKASINAYKDTKSAENIMLTVDDAVVSFVESRDFYKWVRVVPFAGTVFRQLAGIDTEKWWARGLAKGVRPFLNFIANSPLLVRDPEERRVFQEILQRDIKEWPKSFAQLHLSPAIAAGGPSAPALDSLDTDAHFEEIEHAGLVTVNHKKLNELKDKHKAHLLGKFFAVGQRYWWIPLVATVAAGVIVALQEQGVDSGGKSH